MKIKLFILISTIDNRILNLKNILQDYHNNITYNVSHQINEPLDDEVETFINNLKFQKTGLKLLLFDKNGR